MNYLLIITQELAYALQPIMLNIYMIGKQIRLLQILF